MNRRSLLAMPLLLAGCGLATRPYAERRTWPLQERRPRSVAPRAGGRVLLVRSVRAGPGLEARGLQAVQADGSVKTEFYEEWAVPPAEGVEDALRQWLAECGRFAAVVAPGSRLVPGFVLEGSLDALWTVAASRQAHAAVGVTVIEQKGDAPRILLQRTFSADVPLATLDAPDAASGMRAALAQVFTRIEAALPK